MIDLAIAAMLAASSPRNAVSARHVAGDTYRITVRNLESAVEDPCIVFYDGRTSQPWVIADSNRMYRKGSGFTVTIRFPRDSTFTTNEIDGTQPGNPDGETLFIPHGMTRIHVR